MKRFSINKERKSEHLLLLTSGCKQVPKCKFCTFFWDQHKDPAFRKFTNSEAIKQVGNSGDRDIHYLEICCSASFGDLWREEPYVFEMVKQKFRDFGDEKAVFPQLWTLVIEGDWKDKCYIRDIKNFMYPYYVDFRLGIETWSNTAREESLGKYFGKRLTPDIVKDAGYTGVNIIVGYPGEHPVQVSVDVAYTIATFDCAIFSIYENLGGLAGAEPSQKAIEHFDMFHRQTLAMLRKGRRKDYWVMDKTGSNGTGDREEREKEYEF